MKFQTHHPASLINAATPILKFIAQFNLLEAHQYTEQQTEGIHQRLLTEIHKFQLKLIQQDFNKLKVLAASYCLVTCLDELVMNSNLIHGYDWSKHSLLSITHNETWGGENFYKILHYSLQKPSSYLELINLIRLLLKFGYKGKYYQLRHSSDELSSSNHWPRPFPETILNKSTGYKFIIQPKPKLKAKQIIKFCQRLVYALLTIILLITALYHYQLKTQSKDLIKKLTIEAQN